jgi:hypothetical protein
MHHETGQYIARHDPLRFLLVNATPLCSGSHLPDDFVIFLNANGINVVAGGLNNLNVLSMINMNFLKEYHLTQ